MFRLSVCLIYETKYKINILITLFMEDNFEYIFSLNNNFYYWIKKNVYTVNIIWIFMFINFDE